MAEENKDSTGEGQPDTTPQSIQVEMGEETKTLSSSDVANLLKAQSAATKRDQELSPVLKTMEKLNANPEDYARESEAAFGVIYNLQEQGIIDKDGNVANTPPPQETPLQEPSFMGQQPPAQDPTATKALESLQAKYDTLARNQQNMMRLSLESELKVRHPEMTDKNLQEVFARTSADDTKGLWDHAKDISGETKTMTSELRARHAKEFGVDLKEFDENKLNMQEAEGGGAAMFSGKKMSFQKGKHAPKDSITPKEAMLARFKALNQASR